jgi:hypothetical protein
MFLFWAAVHGASAQVAPALRRGPDLSIFSTFSYAKPDFSHYKDFGVTGFSLGGFVQTHHVIGGPEVQAKGAVEIRGSILRWGNGLHQESALAGPRATLSFGRISTYTSALAGAGNAWWNIYTPAGQTVGGFNGVGFQWALFGGVDVRVNQRISLRVGEFGYSRIYEKGKTLTPLYASTGIVYRFN